MSRKDELVPEPEPVSMARNMMNSTARRGARRGAAPRGAPSSRSCASSWRAVPPSEDKEPPSVDGWKEATAFNAWLKHNVHEHQSQFAQQQPAAPDLTEDFDLFIKPIRTWPGR